MANWFEKATDELTQYLAKEYDSPELFFIGKYFVKQDTVRFIDVRTTDYFSLNFLSNDEINSKLKGKKLWVHIHKEIPELKLGVYYQFKAKLSSRTIREKLQNPFALQIDDSFAPTEYIPIPKEFILRRYEIAANTHFANNQQLAKALNSIQREINKSPETFIFELLQNASDYPDKAKDYKVYASFKVTENYLLFCHSGAEFKVNNVHSICSINESDKSDLLDKIGFKGIGFKSVFKDCSFAFIKSGGYSFRFDSSNFVTEKPYQIIPIWTDSNQVAPEVTETTIFKNSSVSIALRPRRKERLLDYEKILNRLFTDDRILLFLPNIEDAKIITPTGFKHSKKNLHEFWIGRESIVIPEYIRLWINKEIDDNESVVPEKFYDIQNSVIQFATSRRGNQILNTERAVFYNYLPTKVNLGFDFLINGDFIPDGTREFFHNILWNDFLIEQSGALFLNWIKSIGSERDTITFKRDYIKIIPDFSKIENQIIDERNKYLITSFKKGFTKALIGDNEHQPTAFIPSESGVLECLSNILIDKTGIASLLGDDFERLTGIKQKLIHEEVGEGVEKIEALIVGNISYGIIYTTSELIENLKLPEFRLWLKTLENNYLIIKFLYNSTDTTLRGILETEDIILSEKGELLKAPDLFSQIPMEIDFLGKNKIHGQLKSLLENDGIILKLKDFDIVECLRANINNFNTFLTNEANILDFWGFVYDNWNTIKEDDEVKKSLSKFNILCKPKSQNVLNIQIVSNTYFPRELAGANEVETIIETLNLPNKHFILPKFDFTKRTNKDLRWNEIFKAAKSTNALKDVINELIIQLKDLNETLHFKVCSELFNYWKSNREKTETQLTTLQITTIQQSLKIKCGDTYFPCNQCIISEHYTGDTRLTVILPNIQLKNQVVKDYQPNSSFVSDWRNFFILIGLKELNSEQKIFNEKIDYYLRNQEELKADHFKVLKDLDNLYTANKNAEIPIVFDFITKLSKLYLQTSIDTIWAQPNDLHFPTDYKPELDLQIDIEINSQFKFLSVEYVKNGISKEFLEDLGVHHNFHFSFSTQGSYNFYPTQLITNKKYLPRIWEFITQSDASLRAFSSSNILGLVKSNSTIEVEGNCFKKPTELYSYNLSSYIEEKALIPKMNLRNFAINNSNLEILLGINQELNSLQCLALLKRNSPLKQEEVNSLKLINVLSRSQLSPDSLTGISLPNTNYSWLPKEELFVSSDSEIITKHPNNLLHSDFQPLSGKLAVKNISSSEWQLQFKIDTDTNSDEEIKRLFKLKADYIAFVIKNGAADFVGLSKQLIISIEDLTFTKCDDLFYSITYGSLNWRKDCLLCLVSNTIYFINELHSEKSEIVEYLYGIVTKYGSITKKRFYRYLFKETEKSIIEDLEKNYELPPEWKSAWIKEVEEFIQIELENTEWDEIIPDLKNILELSKSHPKEKQRLYNLVAKLKLAKSKGIHFDAADKNYNQLINGNDKFFVHSARGSFAYIHTNEILRMKNEGFKMALDFGSRSPIKVYETPEEILRLNSSHLLAYQYEKSMEDLFQFCEANSDANKHLLIIDKDNSKEKSKDIFKLLNPEDDYQ